MDGEVVDLARKLRIVQPHMPRFGGADRHLDVALDVADLADELSRAGRVGITQILLAVPAQDVLVADQHPLYARVLVRHADQRPGLLGIDLARLAAELLLCLVGAIYPRTRHQLQSVLCGDLRHDVAAVRRAVGADILDLAAQHRQVALDLLLARLDDWCRRVADGRAQEAPDAARLGLDRILILGPWGIGDAVQRAFDVRCLDPGVEQAPTDDRSCDDEEKNKTLADHCLNDRSDKPPVAYTVVEIAVACLLRTMTVNARTVPDRLNRRADNHAVRLTSWRLPCARFPRLRPFTDDAATGAIYSRASRNGKGTAGEDGQIAQISTGNRRRASPQRLSP